MPRIVAQFLTLPKFSALNLMSDNRAVAGNNIGHLDFAVEMLAQEMRNILRLYEADIVKPLVDLAVPFAAAAGGLRCFQQGKNIEKRALCEP